MNKETIVTIVIAALVGLIGGYLVFSLSTKPASTSGTSIPSGGGAPVDYSKRIAEAEKLVARDPKNVRAWITLGNDYFDTDQPQKAINAYQQALDLDPNNPDVLTDQGVMYQRVQWFDKAAANFQKAQELNPKHLQSLYNLGIVYAQHLNQPEKAIAAWSRYLELEPSNPNAPQVRMMLEDVQAKSSGRGAKQ